ncbi:AMP-binding protein [Hyphococcus formosus]|uniref:phenylacetate--CoA ligase family protein n=1 Tax=Hyphococcus formosus TaxID=3143534 RepID=UPI00398B89AC
MEQQAPFESSPLLGDAARLSRPELEALQLSKLKQQIARLYKNSAYYRDRMKQAGLTPDDITSIRTFTERFPTTNKADFLKDQNEHPPFGERLSIDRNEVALVNMTGGTSGQGQEIYGRTHRDIHQLGYLHALPWYFAGLRRGQIAINCVPSGGLTTGGWGPAEGFRIIGATAFNAGGTLSTDALIDLMVRIGDVNFIYASTNYLHTLTEAMLKRGISPKDSFPNMRGLFIAAEGYPLEWATKIETHWNCRLQEGYGSTQCNGFGGSTCDNGVFGDYNGRGLIRLFEWEFLFEIIDPDTNQPTEPGERGELVVTTLSAQGSPTVRFRTGDSARYIPWDQVDDGRAWNAIPCGEISRLDDMMKIRGNNVWPSAIDAAIFSFAEVNEYAGRVFTENGKTQVLVRIALNDNALSMTENQKTNFLRSVQDAIKQKTNVKMQIEIAPRSALPEFTYKARRWTDDRQEGYQL